MDEDLGLFWFTIGYCYNYPGTYWLGGCVVVGYWPCLDEGLYFLFIWSRISISLVVGSVGVYPSLAKLLLMMNVGLYTFRWCRGDSCAALVGYDNDPDVGMANYCCYVLTWLFGTIRCWLYAFLPLTVRCFKFLYFSRTCSSKLFLPEVSFLYSDKSRFLSSS